MTEFYRVCPACAHYERGQRDAVMNAMYAHVCRSRAGSSMTAAEEEAFIINSLRRMGLQAVAI